jgi:hypothetical protein
MKVVIDIPKDFTGDYIADKFKDFFSRVIADIDCNGMCGRYEKEIAEMFLKAFDDSEENILQPTAYDVDTVVNQLEEYGEELERFGCSGILADMIEVVRVGGIDV